MTFRGLRVVRAYFGKIGCACGCRGEYHEDPEMIAKAVKKLESAEVQTAVGMDGGLIAWADFGGRTVTVYCDGVA